MAEGSILVYDVGATRRRLLCAWLQALVFWCDDSLHIDATLDLVIAMKLDSVLLGS